MTLTDAPNHTWTGFIPYQQTGAEVFYYIHAEANSGKQQVRPITAPEGWWMFLVTGTPTGLADVPLSNLRMYPNPSSGSITIESAVTTATLLVCDMTGRVVGNESLEQPIVHLDLSNLSPGFYLVHHMSELGTVTRKIVLDTE